MTSSARELEAKLCAVFEVSEQKSCHVRAAKRAVKKRCPDEIFSINELSNVTKCIEKKVRTVIQETELDKAVALVDKVRSEDPLQSEWTPSGVPEDDLVAHRVDAKQMILQEIQREIRRVEQKLRVQRNENAMKVKVVENFKGLKNLDQLQRANPLNEIGNKLSRKVEI